jgi:PAS domain S-box-containing protein
VAGKSYTDHATSRRAHESIAEQSVASAPRFSFVCEDVTAHQRIEQALRDSEARLRVALRSAGLGIQVWEPPTGALYWDARVRELWDVGPDEPVDYTTFREGVHPDDRARVEAALEHALQSRQGGTFVADYRVIGRRNRVERCVRATGQVDFDAGKPVRLVGSVQDITDWKSAETALQERSERLAVLSEAAGALLAQDDPAAYLDRIYRRLAALLDLDLYLHFRVAEDHRSLELVASRGLDPGSQAQVATLGMGEAVCGSVAAQCAPIVLAEVQTSDDHRAAFLRRIGVTAYACHPLVANGELLGTLSFGCRASTAFTHDSVALMRAVCGLVATALGRRRARDALVASERRFREMADTAPAMLWVADAQGACTFLSRGWYEFTGQAEAEGLGLGWTRAVHPDDREQATTQFVRASARREPFQLEYRLRRRDGQYRWAIDAGRPRLAADGAVLDYIGSVIDIDELKAAESGLRQREQNLATAFRVNPQPMFIVRARDQRYVEVNEPWERLTGYARAEAIGRTSAELALYGDVQDRARFYAALQGAGATRDFELDTRTRGGRIRRVAVSAEVAEIGGETCVIGAVSDITERRQIEVERARLLQAERDARREAERANRIKDEFLATVSHELRTPLNAMLGWAHILARRGEDAALLKEGLSVIERNARAQAQLIADLLDMSRIVSGKLRLEMESVDLHEVLRAAVETVRPAAQAKNIQVSVALEPRVGPVQGDPQRLQQVVWNLLSNAVKFTPADGAVQAVVSREGATAQLRVTDSGQGIPADLLPHVFDRFRQADSSTTRRHGGLGLGLSIVKQLVGLHGGTVRAHSAGPGRGATFVIQLPLLEAQAAPASDAAAQAAGAAADRALLAGLTVIAVDDEPDALMVVRHVLEDCKARVITAGSAEEALALIAEEHPDVLLSDIGMPEVDGYELIRRVRATRVGAALPAAAITAYARDEDEARAKGAGYQAHVAKPLHPQALIETVAMLAGRMRAAR